ncbi:MAG: hypothetical protein RIQ53_4547 [Pseudomonadota bacterium]
MSDPSLSLLSVPSASRDRPPPVRRAGGRGAARSAGLLALAATALLAACGADGGTTPGPGLAGASSASVAGPAQAAAPAGTASPAGGRKGVGVVTARTESLQLTTELNGRVAAAEVAEIRPQVAGVIQAVRFAEGARVRAGQVLYEIDPASYRAALASAQAAAQRAEAATEAAKLNAQRQADLFKAEATSAQLLQDARITLRQAEADLAAARAAVDTARLNLQRASVVSPIDGVADLSTVRVGALVSAAQTTALTTVRQLDPVLVDVSQSATELLQLRREAAGRGQDLARGEARAPVRLQLEDGTVYGQTGQLGFSGVAVNTTTGGVTLRARFPNPQGVLMPGMYVRARVQTAEIPDALLLPQQAVRRQGAGGSALVVEAGGTVVRRTLQLGRVVDDRVLVLAGVQPGEQVIVEGSQKVKPGEVVQVWPVDPVAVKGRPVLGGGA